MTYTFTIADLTAHLPADPYRDNSEPTTAADPHSARCPLDCAHGPGW